jgi:hypothetical protein
MAPLELHVDPSATADIYIAPSALPPGAIPGDLVAIRPANVGKGKAKDRPLLYKVPARVAEEDDDGGKGRRGSAQVIVTPNVALSFTWAKRRTQVVLDLVSVPARAYQRILTVNTPRSLLHRLRTSLPPTSSSTSPMFTWDDPT